MHLGNGAITPECSVIALGVAAAGVGVAWHTLHKNRLSRNQALTAGALGAAVFAAQMLNVTILPFGSAHLVGGVLLAWMLGPSLGFLVMATILSLQAALLGDGGLLALGVNIVNMGLVPSALVAVARRYLGRTEKGATPVGAGVALAGVSVISIIAAAALIVGEVAMFRSPGQLEGLGTFASQMLATHAVIGLAEGALTVALVMLIARSPQPATSPLCLSRWRAAALGTGALMLAILCLPALGWVSGLPDGYEAAVHHAQQSGLAIGALESTEQMAGLNGRIELIQSGFVSSFAEHELALVLLTTLLAGAVAWGIASSTSKFRYQT